MIDLHVHTKTSDGSLTAREVISLAKKNGITHMAITDHDTTQGLKDALDLGNEIGVKIIPGIEISAYDFARKKKVHILGFNIEPEHPALTTLCAPLVLNRNQALFDTVQSLISVGYDLSWEKVQKYAEGGTGVYKQHIMHALLDRGYCESIYCDLYKTLFTHISLEYVDVAAAIQAVREAGGLAVLAHPGLTHSFEGIEEWVELGLAGIEVFHPAHNLNDIERSLQYARTNHLIITGGSDYHGFYGEIYVEPGCPDLGHECIRELAAGKSKILESKVGA